MKQAKPNYSQPILLPMTIMKCARVRIIFLANLALMPKEAMTVAKPCTAQSNLDQLFIWQLQLNRKFRQGMVSASRSYEANLAALQTAKQLALKAIDIGGK